jgi:hypothetical protein
VGKTIDMEKAYKQLIVAPKGKWASSISVFDPLRSLPALFSQVTLPFGATSSVIAFNRVSRGLWRIGVGAGLIWANFYDDFPIVSPSSVSTASKNAANLIFQLLGWKISSDAEKCFDFAASFAALGVFFHLDRTVIGCSEISNKSTRVQQVTQEIQDILSCGSITSKQAESLRGKLQFMETAMFGRASRAIYSVFHRATCSPRLALAHQDSRDLRWLINWLGKLKPRRISPDNVREKVLLFTDGACEPCTKSADSLGIAVSCGGVLVDPITNEVRAFGGVVPPELVQLWASDGRRQLVTESELLPHVIARRLWSKQLANRRVLSFVDSEPAKFSLVRGGSNSIFCGAIVRMVVNWDAEFTPWNWYSRIPSYSNPADKPSRLDWQSFLEEFPGAVIEDISNCFPTLGEFTEILND